MNTKQETAAEVLAHPIQPLQLDERGTLRFKRNAIVRHLFDHGGIDLNAIACMDFSREDREQFAQLIGYSHDGAGTLSYFSDEVWESALDEYENRRLERALSAQQADFPECSGDPRSCPENEGYGCCKPNPTAQQAKDGAA